VGEEIGAENRSRFAQLRRNKILDDRIQVNLEQPALAERAGVCDTAGKGGETLLAGGCSLKRLLHAGEHGGHSFSNCCSNARKESIFCSLQAWLATSEAAFRLIFWSSCSILASSGDEKQEKCKYPAQ